MSRLSGLLPPFREAGISRASRVSPPPAHLIKPSASAFPYPSEASSSGGVHKAVDRNRGISVLSPFQNKAHLHARSRLLQHGRFAAAAKQLLLSGSRDHWTALQQQQQRAFSSTAAGGHRAHRRSSFPALHLGLVAVPHQMAYVVERFGRFHRVLESGLHVLIPFADRVAYAHSLKEEALTIPNQTAITRDNVTLQIDGVLYVRIEDAYKASYGVEDPIFAVTQLAQTTMRSELGKLTLDNTFLERTALNQAIVEAIKAAAGPWGLTCLRYEIRDILLPANIRSAMERQAEAERLKRAEVLRSEGERARLVNLALGQKEATILNAEGQAEGVRQRAAAAAESIRKIAETTSIQGGMHALSLQLAENYVSAFGRLAEKSNTLIVPADAANAAQMLGQALGIFKAVDQSYGKQIRLLPAVAAAASSASCCG